MTRAELLEACGGVENPEDIDSSQILNTRVRVRECGTNRTGFATKYQNGSGDGSAFVEGEFHFHWLDLTELELDR